MYDYRGYLVILSAVFLALAIGLLVGVSYGEDILIYNQQEVIELLERRLSSQDAEISMMKEELHAWDTFREYFWTNFYSGVFPEEDEYSIDIISDSISLSKEINQIMEKQGVNCRVITINSGFDGYHHVQSHEQIEPAADNNVSEVDFLVSLLSPEGSNPDQSIDVLNKLESTGELEISGDWSVGPVGNVVLLLNEAGKQDTSEGSESDPEPFIKELASRLEEEGHAVIIAFAGYDSYQTSAGIEPDSGNKKSLPDNYLEWGETIVDHADTFWGQVTLLEIMRTETKGHYGFNPTSQGVLP